MTRLFYFKTITIAILLTVACSPQTPVPPPPPPIIYPAAELKYILIASFDDLFYVDPDFYPVAREGAEQKNALAQFSTIRADRAEFEAIMKHLNLPENADYTTEEMLRVYREHKRLTFGVQMAAAGDLYRFMLRVKEGQGERIEGTITATGKITVLKREPSMNIYPICLVKGTLIDAPDGLVPVEQIRAGMVVWTFNLAGEALAGVVTKTVETRAPPSFRVVRVILADGRAVTASPGHPTAEGRRLGDLRFGDTLDGSRVAKVEYMDYEGPATYDILPSGGTGLYRANDILLRSTLADR